MIDCYKEFIDYNNIINNQILSTLELKIENYLEWIEANRFQEILSGLESLNIYIENFNIKEFGAKPNDMIDDSDAIQNAINNCKKNGKVVIPNGTFLIKKPIYLKSNISIELSSHSVILGSDDLNSKPMFLGENISNISIEGGHLIGNKYTGVPIRIIKSNEISIKSVKISDFMNGIIIEDSKKIKIYRCTISNLIGDKTGGIGISINESCIAKIDSNIIDSVYQDGILVYNNSKHVSVLNNSISNWNLENDYGRAGIQAYFSKDVKIKNNLCYCYDGKRIEDFPTQRIGIRCRDSYNVDIKFNNVRECQGIGIESIYIGDNPSYIQKNINIIGNNIKDVYGSGINNTNLSTNKNLIKNVYISKNIIENIKFINENNSGNGIVSNALNHTISKNLIKNCYDTSITAIGEEELIISNNIMVSLKNNKKAIHKSHIFIKGKNIDIQKNVFADFTEDNSNKYAVKLYGKNSELSMYKNIILNNLKNRIEGSIIKS
ncbi:MAG: hypothetical protein KIB00_14680 [Paeniclostridium sordellii]|uniref:glycosyl hydrolase family 28-related protein n=1 Tax=Paraclostridium sordellii TaxID=1505 RepID=UPI0005E7885F|nr:glycosyl hydrolase family 28-related protein [Paeniclostridium sordellii]MBS6025320.1 hypothetical protein [Paeniclostridium sordellii]CEN94052.1 glycoside hydrolase family protein [[Clostridium] sordellii] [Paeniclostridium sordellii]CEN96054.1 glycoside hydrolase family protein [[Clostridium] sordellii] [Paeniclostridium sordellii]